MDHVDLGWARFSPALMAASTILIFQFFFSWYLDIRKTGWTISLWTYTRFMYFVLPVLVMYPFAGSVFNFISTGEQILKIQPFVDEAFIVTVLGYVSFLLGGVVCTTLSGQSRRLYTPGRPLRLLELVLEENYRSDLSARILVPILTGCLLMLVLLAGGLSFNLRGQYLGDGALRPFFNFAVTLTPMTMVFVGIRFIDRPRKLTLLLFFVVAAMSMMLGSRSSLLGPVMIVFVLYAYKCRGRMALWRIAVVAFLMFLVLLVLGSLRSGGSVSSGVQSFGSALLYGNNYSDVRDFAWIISCWDRQPLLGRSYLAGFLSFIPSSLSDFRMEWSISRVTNHWVGFNTDLHPGLRPGPFGESYFNFGIAGVFAIGLASGFAIRAADLRIRSLAIGKGSVAEIFSRTLPANLVTSLYITAGFFGMYVFVFMHLGLFLLRRLLAATGHTGASRLRYAHTEAGTA